MSEAKRAENFYRPDTRWKPSQRLVMASLAESEARIIGVSRLSTLRDIAIAAVRVVTLLAAVLLPSLTDQPPTAPPRTPDDQINLESPVTNLNLSISMPEPVETSGDDPVHATLTNINRIEVVNLEPLTLAKLGEVNLVVSGRAGFWYRTELGVNDVFWALPDGKFYMKVQDFADCDQGLTYQTVGGSSRTICQADLEFVFEESQTGVAGATTSQPPTRCNNSGVVLGSGGSASGSLDCVYQSGAAGLTVRVKQAPEPSNVPGKVAFNIKWCRSTTVCPD